MSLPAATTHSPFPTLHSYLLCFLTWICLLTHTCFFITCNFHPIFFLLLEYVYGWLDRWHGWMDTGHYRDVWTEMEKRRMSAVCQRFWWVDGRADTALGIRGQPSAYPSIPPSSPLSIHLSILSIYPLSNWVSLAKGRERGIAWKSRAGALPGSFQTLLLFEHSTYCITCDSYFFPLSVLLHPHLLFLALKICFLCS